MIKSYLVICFLMLLGFNNTGCKKDNSTGMLEVTQKNLALDPWVYYRIWNQETYIAMKANGSIYFTPLYSTSGNGSRSFVIKDMIPGWYGIIINFQGNLMHESQFYIEPGKTKRIEP